MQNEIYSRLVRRAVREGHPSYSTRFSVTEEVNGFALWRVTYIDEEGDDDRPYQWFAGTGATRRNEAIEAAVALVFEEEKTKCGS